MKLSSSRVFFLVAVLTVGVVAPALAAVPTNDDFADAAPITEGVEVRADLTDATPEADEGYCGDDSGAPTVWWEFTAPTAGDYVTYATGANIDTTIAWAESLTDSDDCADDSDHSYDAVSSPVTLAEGEVKYVQLSAYESGEPGSAGAGVARLTLGADAFADRAPLEFRDGASTAVIAVEIEGSVTAEAGEPIACGTHTVSQTIWLTFTPPSTQVWHIQAKFETGTPFQMGIYSGSTIDSLDQLTCVFVPIGEGVEGPSALAVELTAGTTYAIQLDIDGDDGHGIVRAEPAGSFRSLATLIDLDGDGESSDVGEESDAAILLDGRPIVAYRDGAPGDDEGTLRFAERDAAGVWSDTLIDADGDGTSENVGNEIALAVLPDGRPILAYEDTDNGELRFAERDADGSWSDTLIDADGDGTSTNVGDELALVVLPDGRPVVAYRDSDNDELRFAERDADGIWSDTLIDADGDGTSENVGDHIAMILHGGNVVVAYSDDANTQMRLAERAANGTWSETMVRGTEAIGDAEYIGANGQPSLAMTPEGSLAIAVQDDETGHTWFGVRSGGQWEIEEILTDRFLAEWGTGSWVKLHFDRAGNPVIIWVDDNNDNPTGVSVRTGGTWSEQIPVPFLLNPSDPASDGSLEQSPDQFGSVVMPDGRIAFTAYDGANGGLYWVEDIHRSCPVAASPFTDVDPSSYAADAIDCIYGLGITTGTSNITYSPNEYATREQVAAFVARTYRAMTGASCSGGATPFTDVDPGSYAAGDIGCLYGLGVVNGTSGTTYSPDEFVTREQAAALLARLYRLVTDPSCSGGATPFTDVAPGPYAADDIGCLYGLGVTNGTSSTTYSPNEYATRQQLAAFLGRIWMAPAIIS